MKLLVTGGAGFIGSNFVHHLLRNHPADEVIVVDRLTYAGNLRNLGDALQGSCCRFVRLDICDPALRDIVKGCDAVVHFAAESHVDRSIEEAAPFVRTNVEGSWRLVDACRAGRVSRFVHVSTDEVYGSLGPAFYGLRTTILTLLLMALLRIKRPEALKEHSPDDLGRLLGLDRAPEVKTLRRKRRKLSRLAAVGRASQFGRALAERRVQARGMAMGFLYVDGHVRVYHGKHQLPKAHAARLRMATPATTDYWVNDAASDPLFVVTAEANAGLAQVDGPPDTRQARRHPRDRRERPTGQSNRPHASQPYPHGAQAGT